MFISFKLFFIYIHQYIHPFLNSSFLSLIALEGFWVINSIGVIAIGFIQQTMLVMQCAI